MDKIDADIKTSFDFGKLSSHQIKNALLVLSIVFFISVALVQNYYYALAIKSFPRIEEKTVAELKKEKLELEIRNLVKGTPIERMASYIAEKDKKTAAYLVAIAKKESNWGKRIPVLDGKDCYNYWGYRGQNERMGSGGHTCFDNPQQAVNVVSQRVSELIRQNNVQSAKNMIVWKCGYSCEGHSEKGVKKWIKDVDYYSKKILN
ncbi:MAG TPA: hypothetical protein DEA27_04195 [Candidatus Moranbacteria bacterium]|nr:hypothetical protein [Candidatus Moranbacteria bacterium]